MIFKKLIIFSVVLSLLIFSGFGCKGPTTEEQEAAKTVTLEFWGVYDESDLYKEIIAKYRAHHPNVKIEYKMFRFEEYEDELLDALAEDRGPDIFMVNNNWMRGYVNKMLPLPPELTIAYIVTEGGVVGQSTTVTVQTEKSLTRRQLKELFVEVVDDNAVIPIWNEEEEIYENKIMGLPLSVDTLALYYNRDILNASGIAEPPDDWVDFQDQVREITKYDADGDIAQSAAAIGTASNVERYADILSILMMQNGTEMTNDSGYATFHQKPSIFERDEAPGWGATRFYTDFAISSKDVYTWNDDFPISLDAFVTGESAMFVGYSYNTEQIRAKAPKLNFGIARLPQLAGNPEVNYANFWNYAVSQKTENADYAWDFIQFMTTDEEIAKIYLDTGNRPTALRSLINEQLENLDLSVFASQVLTAKDWYRGTDWEAVEEAFADLIDSQVYGTMELDDAMKLTASRVNQTL